MLNNKEHWYYCFACGSHFLAIPDLDNPPLYCEERCEEKHKMLSARPPIRDLLRFQESRTLSHRLRR